MRIRLPIAAVGTASGLLAFCGTALAQPSMGREHIVPLFMSTSNLDQQGFVRVINHSGETATVSIVTVDDSGARKPPIALTVEPRSTIHFNSEDLEHGNADKGLPDGVGAGTGNWRLHLRSRQDIEPLAYIRTRADGFLTSMFAVAPEGRMRHRVSIFNPGSNDRQRSWLRLVNLSERTTTVRIRGLDDDGRPGPGGEVRLSLRAHAAEAVTARELESGGAALTGRLGDGAAKWRLTVAADEPILVMSLMDTPSGHLSNLSATEPDHAGPANVWELSFEDGVTEAGLLIVTPDSRLYGWLPEAGAYRIADGAYDSDAGGLTASGKLYESGEINVEGLAISGGSEPFELSATYRVGDWIKGRYTAGGVSRAFHGAAFGAFGRGADPAALAGTWDDIDGFSYSLDAEGNFKGSVTIAGFDCDVSGTLETINPAFNLYEGTVAYDCGILGVNAEVIGAIGDLPTSAGGGDFAGVLVIARDEEVAIGILASRR